MADNKENCDVVPKDIVTLLFGQVKQSNDNISKEVEHLTVAITGLVQHVGKHPEETLELIRELIDIVKDIQRDDKVVNTNNETILNLCQKMDKTLDAINNKIFKLTVTLSVAWGLGVTLFIILQKFVDNLPK